MSRLISEILGIPQPSLGLQIEELERLSGRPGLDIKLASELRLLFKEKARLLGLDENDTTARELYFAMSNLVLENSEKLAQKIGIDVDDSPRQVVDKSISFVEKRIGKKVIWSLKPSIARRQIKDNPPKKLMKIFGIRSIDSALKRERVSIFYCFARFAEPPSWFSKYASQASKLTNSDFDNSHISISVLSESRRKQLVESGAKLNQIIYSDPESAGIEICVPEKRFKGDVLFIVDSLLVQIKNMLRRSEYYKSQGLRPDFFTKIEKIRQSGFHSVETDNAPYDWQTVVHGATELGVVGLVQGDEPFASMEDLIVPSLAHLVGFDFWKHPYGLYSAPDFVISFNLSDMIVNAINSLPPSRAYIDNGRRVLRNELFARYLRHEPVRLRAINMNDPGN